MSRLNANFVTFISETGHSQELPHGDRNIRRFLVIITKARGLKAKP